MPVVTISLDLETVLPENRIFLPVMDFPEIPNPVTLSKDAVWHSEAIPGRSEPWTSYAYSGPTPIHFTVQLVATGQVFGTILPSRLQRETESRLSGQLLGLHGPLTGSLEDAGFAQLEVHQRAAWLLALTYPQYDRLGRAFAPPAVYFLYGANFVRRCIVTNVTLAYHGPWHPDTLLSYKVDATLTLQEQNLVPVGYADARLGIFGQIKSALGGNGNSTSVTDLARSSRGL